MDGRLLTIFSAELITAFENNIPCSFVEIGQFKFFVVIFVGYLYLFI